MRIFYYPLLMTRPLWGRGLLPLMRRGVNTLAPANNAASPIVLPLSAEQVQKTAEIVRQVVGEGKEEVLKETLRIAQREAKTAADIARQESIDASYKILRLFTGILIAGMGGLGGFVYQEIGRLEEKMDRQNQQLLERMDKSNQTLVERMDKNNQALLERMDRLFFFSRPPTTSLAPEAMPSPKQG